MNLVRGTARYLTMLIPFKGWRKTARQKAEDGLNRLFRTEHYRCEKEFEAMHREMIAMPREKFHFISLGTNCFVRLTFNLWGIKRRKAEGGVSMPFDLAIHPLPVVIKFLNNDFAGYFDNCVYDQENGYWINPQDDIKFIHEKENDREAFEERYRNRIENLREALADELPALLACHVMGDVDGKLVDKLYDAVQKRCPHKKFTLLMFVFNGKVSAHQSPAVIYETNFPYEGYLYMDRYVKYTRDGLNFEKSTVLKCRDLILDLFN